MGLLFTALNKWTCYESVANLHLDTRHSLSGNATKMNSRDRLHVENFTYIDFYRPRRTFKSKISPTTISNDANASLGARFELFGARRPEIMYYMYTLSGNLAN